MRSSSGQYYVGLDHVRALAAFMVFSWHFITLHNGELEPPLIFPLSFLSEGHTGVALFMTLSGYLFAKLLDRKRINYLDFIWNRLVRLLPLLILVLFLVGVRDYYDGSLDITSYLRTIALGVFLPSLPNGAWSITVEFHFYIILPLLLVCARRANSLLFLFVCVAIALRYCLFVFGESAALPLVSYSTIIGRADQFILGIAAFHYQHFFKKKHLLAVMIFIAFSSFFMYFDSLGGMYRGTDPSIWIYMTTVEGAAYAALIAWYDTSFRHAPGRVSKFIALIGAYSYSIYLLHFFFFNFFAVNIERYIMDLSNIYVALLFSPVAFLAMVPLGYLSFRFVESPFLKFRRSYIRQVEPPADTVVEKKTCQLP